MSHDVSVASHFPNLEVQNHAARLGMWLFLASELLLFGGLFAAYSVYRFLFPEAFAAGSHHLSVAAGTVNTVVLITSSMTVALSHDFTRRGRQGWSVACLLVSILFGFVFLGIKAIEWTTHFREHALPGSYYRMEEVQQRGVSMFYSLYFLMTGLHGLHVIIGMTALGYAAWRILRGTVTARENSAVELVGLYWHLVDIIWIFLYPLLYLM